MNIRLTIAVFLIGFLYVPFLPAQNSVDNEEGELIKSMGIPSRTEFSWGPMFILDNTSKENEYRYGGGIHAGVFRNLSSPIMA